MESSLRIYMKTQSSEKRLLEEVDGAKIFPVYGEAVLLICSSPRIATWSRAEGSDIPTVQPESTLISSLFPQQRQNERENLALETDSDNGMYQIWQSREKEQWLVMKPFRKSYRDLYACETTEGVTLIKHIVVVNSELYKFYFVPVSI